jgi:hypothetical protein
MHDVWTTFSWSTRPPKCTHSFTIETRLAFHVSQKHFHVATGTFNAKKIIKILLTSSYYYYHPIWSSHKWELDNWMLLKAWNQGFKVWVDSTGSWHGQILGSYENSTGISRSKKNINS